MLSHTDSPIKLIHLRDVREDEDQILDQIQQGCLKKGLAIVKTYDIPKENFPHKTCLRIAVSCAHDERDIATAIELLKTCVEEVMSSYKVPIGMRLK